MNRGILAAAALCLVISALGVVHVRHQHRVAFFELQEVLSARDRLNTEWSQLLLEQSTWSFHHVVEKKARGIGMTVPGTDQIRVLTKP